MKKFLALALASVMAVSLVACGSTNADTNAESSAAATTTAAATESGSEEPGLKIAIVSSPSGVDDGSFNQDNYNGVLKFIEENPNATVTPIREETGDSAAAVQAVADVVADYDVIVCCGFQFAGIGNLAQENPDTKFILIDSWPTIDGTEVTADQVIDNVYAAYYAEQESGFYAGMAAALSTTTGKVAVVNGIAYPSNVNYQYGFECGVKYVNGTEGMNVEVVELPSYAGTDVTGANVGGNYVGNFSDEATGKVLGNALIAEGVDILFVAAGGSGNGVFTAAKEADGVKVIGCDVDQYDDGANGDSIFDYSWREWAGLINGYYLPRWQKFYTMLQGHLDAGTDYQEEGLSLAYGREDFRANDFYNRLAEWELAYVDQTGKARTPVTHGDELVVTRRLFDKYLKLSREYYADFSGVGEIKEERTYENVGEE